jgi:putative MATE family efflux protein
MATNGRLASDQEAGVASHAEVEPVSNTLREDRPLWRAVLLLALPVLAQQFLVLVVSLSDRFLAGRFAGMPEPTANAAEVERTPQQVAYQSAQTTANYLAWFISSYTVLVSVGSTALVARFVGGGERGLAIHATNQSLLLALAAGVLGTIAGLAGLRLLITLLGLHGDAAHFAVEYLTPLVALLVFQVIESAGIACLVGAGDTVTGLLVMTGVAVVNLPLAWGLCLGFPPLLPKMGFPGIAMGTAISHVLGATVVLTTLARGRAGLQLRLPQLWPNADLLARLLRIGIPAGMDSLSIVAGQLWFLSIVNKLGDVAGGAHGIALGWEGLGYLSGAAFGTAGMTLVGQNLGAGKPERAARSGWVAFALGGTVMSVMGIVFFIFAPQMFALFCPHPSQEPIIEAGVPVLRLVAFAMPALASTIIFTYALRGAGDTRVPVLFTWVGFLGVRIPLAYWLTYPELHFGGWSVPGGDLHLMGAWLAMFADLFVRGAFFLARFAGGRWQLVRV